MTKSFGFYALKFTTNAAFAIAVLLGLFTAAEVIWPDLFQNPSGPVLGGIIGGSVGALMIPVTAVAKRFYTEEGRSAKFAEGFVLSVLFAIGLCIAGVVVTVVANTLLYGRPLVDAQVDALLADPAALAMVLGIAFTVIVIMIWPLFIAGIKGEMKRAARAG